MADLEKFIEQVKTRLGAAQREPKWLPEQSRQYMAEIASRRRSYEEIARRLVRTVIQPRLAAVAASFSNATADQRAPWDRCAYWFGYCDRFPATTKVEIAVEHDEYVGYLVVRYELYVMPIFCKFDQHNKVTYPLDAIDDHAVADWVETALLGFLDNYLKLDRGQNDFIDDVVVDPVCGMRMFRSATTATMDYQGHPYHFCAEDCRQLFAENPLRYIQFKAD